MTLVRTLLLTDVVDSTRLAESLGDEAAARLWAAHDRAARDLLLPWRGREIDKTDGMLLLFEQVADAVHYAAAYHRAMATLPVPVQARAGLHVGPVILRENPAEDVARGGKPLEVDGIAKPTTARVMSVARGGQTLLTPEARQALLAAGELQDQHTVSHGHWMLKGLSDPIELFEVGTDPAAFATPSEGEKAYRVVPMGERWRPVREIANNLPEQPNAFVGRQREIAELKALLRKARLVTLLGMGGLGKTRLSQQVGAELMAERPDGVWFIDLAPLRDGNLVPAEAAQALGVREEPGRPLLQSVAQHLKDQRALLIVDNCEHLLEPAARLIQAVLKLAPGVAVLASSRTPLRLPGEQLFPVQPLPLPAARDGLPALRGSTAVRLFVERAREQRHDFDLVADNAAAVAELVTRLEGIPLALELAAARLRAMTVADINRRLKNRFKLLTGGSALRDARQQTLRGLVDWSYDLLQPDEQRVLQALAAFAGGFDLEAAEAVCADGDEVEADDVLDLLTSLVEKSLVAMEQREGEGRFRMLETIREYAAEKLAESGQQPATAARHAAHYFGLAKLGREGMQGPGQGEWLNRLELEQDNLRAAVATAQAGLGGTDPMVAVKMAVALQNFWIMRGGCGEGRELVRQLLDMQQVQALPMAHAFTLYLGAALAWTQGDLDEALRLLHACLALRRAMDAPRDLAATLSTLSMTYASSGDTEAAWTAASEAVQLMQQCGYRNGEAITRVQLGQIEMHRGRFEAARTQMQAAMDILRALKHPEAEGEAELALSELAQCEARWPQARLHAQRSLDVCAQAGDNKGRASAVWMLGRLDVLEGHTEQATGRLADALQAFWDLELRALWLACIEDVARWTADRLQPHAAWPFVFVAQRLRDGAHTARSPDLQRTWQDFLVRLDAATGAAARAACEADAAGWDAAQTHAHAIALLTKAGPDPA